MVALIGALDAPIIYMATVWWRTAHPELNTGPLAEEADALGSGRVYITLLVSVVAFTALYVLLLMERYSLRRSRQRWMSCTEVSPRVGLVLRIALVVVLSALMAPYAGAGEVHASGRQAEETTAQPETPQQSDEMDGESELPWLFAVFAITWAAFFAYVFIMSRRQREMQRELDHLKRSLEDREAATPHAPDSPEGGPLHNRHSRESGNPETGRPG